MLDCQFLLPFSDLMDARSTAGKRVSSTLTSTLAETDSLVLGQGRAGQGCCGDFRGQAKGIGKNYRRDSNMFAVH